MKKDEIYVSHVIGKYVKSPIIGKFTKAKAKKIGIKFEPQKYGYTGAENPIGKYFSGIVRFVTPVYKNDKKIGYLSMVVDHRHIMDFTDYFNPLHVSPLLISDASSGNYAFMWGNDFRCISHPRDYFINGYDANTGKPVPGWIGKELAIKYKKSGVKDLNVFLKTQKYFSKSIFEEKAKLSTT